MLTESATRIFKQCLGVFVLPRYLVLSLNGTGEFEAMISCRPCLCVFPSLKSFPSVFIQVSASIIGWILPSGVACSRSYFVTLNRSQTKYVELGLLALLIATLS